MAGACWLAWLPSLPPPERVWAGSSPSASANERPRRYQLDAQFGDP